MDVFLNYETSKVSEGRFVLDSNGKSSMCFTSLVAAENVGHFLKFWMALVPNF